MAFSETQYNLPVIPGVLIEDDLRSQTSSTDLLLAVVGGLINADGVLTFHEIEKVEEKLPSLVGQHIDEMEFKTKTLYHILHPPEDITLAIKSLCNIYNDRGFTTFTRINIFSGLLEIITECHQINSKAISYLHLLYEQLEIDDPSLLKKLINLYEYDIESPGYSNLYVTFLDKAKSWLEKGLNYSTYSFTSATQKFNREINKKVRLLEQLAIAFSSKKLKREIDSLKQLVRNQPFKIVICGEVKQGKSSLLNAILGINASPVASSMASTAANFRLQYSKEIKFKGQWLPESDIEKLEKYLKSNSKRPIEKELLRRVEALKANHTIRPGEEITSIQSLEDLPEYIAVDGTYTPLVKEVTYYAPIEILKNGAVLVDTPGLNDHVAIRTEFSIQESLGADCIIYIVNAKSFRASEQKYIETLAKSGRAINLIVVVGHIDQIPKEKTHSVLQYIQKWINGICENTPIQLVGIIPMNIAKAMKLRCSGSYCSEQDDTGLNILFSKIEQVLNEDPNNNTYRTKIKNRLQSVFELAEKDCIKFIEYINTSRPDEALMQKLKDCSDMLHATCEKLYSSVRIRLRDVYIDADRFPDRYISEINDTKEAA